MEHPSFLRHWRTVLASVAGMATLLTATSASAALTSYTDVEANAYYEQAAANLLSIGALDASQTKLRPADLATRAEVFKMLVDLNDEPLIYPAVSTFRDVSRSAWYFPHVEAAAKAGWLHGDNDCYGRGSTCTARPNGNVNRAEMTALLQRAFGLSYTGAAPRLPDVPANQWYSTPVQTAADHCILQGDANTGLARPGAFMNRAEMVVMFDRADQNLRYGEDCGVQPEPTGSINSINVVSADTIRVMFNVDLDPNREDDMDRYTLERASNGANVDVSDLSVINARIVELTLDSPLSAGVQYRLAVDTMRTRGGAVFSDTQTFTSDEGTEASIESVTMRSSNMLRVRFSTDVTSGRADDAFRYSLMKTASGTSVGISTASIVDTRTVDLTLTGALSNNMNYRLRVQDLTTKDGTSFSDDFTFSASSQTSSSLSLDSLTATASNHLRLQFSGALNKSSAEDESRYTLSGVSGELGITAATATSSGSVDLTLAAPLQSQQSYTVSVNDLQSSNGVLFDSSKTIVYAQSNVQFAATLNGSNEVPSTGSSATGTGAFTLTSTGLQYDITVKGFGSGTVTAAHFHRGAFGVSGPVIQSISFTGNHASGTWTNLTQQDRDDLLNGRIYANVHTSVFPDGEIRGQVLRQ